MRAVCLAIYLCCQNARFGFSGLNKETRAGNFSLSSSFLSKRSSRRGRTGGVHVEPTWDGNKEMDDEFGALVVGRRYAERND